MAKREFTSKGASTPSAMVVRSARLMPSAKRSSRRNRCRYSSWREPAADLVPPDVPPGRVLAGEHFQPRPRAVLFDEPAAIVGPVIITELSNRAKAALPPGAARVNIYDTPLQVLAVLLAVGFVLTLLVRPLRSSASARAEARVTA